MLVVVWVQVQQLRERQSRKKVSKQITNAGLFCGARPQVVFHLIFKNCKPVHVETPTLQGMVGDGVGSGYASTLYNSNFNCFKSDQELQN